MTSLDVERNALRANLVPRAEDWQWSSLWRREHGTPEQRRCLSTWPLPRPRAGLQFVNEAEAELELDALRRRVKRGHPYGSDQWIEATAKKLNLQSTLESPCRPKKQAPNNPRAIRMN